MTTVVERIQAFNQGRNEQILQLKYKKMRVDVFAFFRGTCHLFYEDWPATSSMNEAPATWICGDAHLQNFGAYKGNNRLVYFDINDFDESVLAPCTWDLARFLTSLLLSASTLHFDKDAAQTLCHDFLHSYTNSLAEGRVQILDKDTTTGVVKDLLTQLQERKRKDFLQSKTRTLPNGTRILNLHDEQIDMKHEATQRAEMISLIEKWKLQQAHPQFYTILDIAFRIAGIGSLGIERYALLVEGKGSSDQNYLLDLKEACPSSLSPYLKLPQPAWKNEAERVITICSWFQEASPALLDAIHSNEKSDLKSFVLRELQPAEDKVKPETVEGKMSLLEDLVKTMGVALACGYLRSGGQQGSATAEDLIAFAQTPHWHSTLIEYAQTYAGQVHADYQSFCIWYDANTAG